MRANKKRAIFITLLLICVTGIGSFFGAPYLDLPRWSEHKYMYRWLNQYEYAPLLEDIPYSDVLAVSLSNRAQMQDGYPYRSKTHRVVHITTAESRAQLQENCAAHAKWQASLPARLADPDTITFFGEHADASFFRYLENPDDPYERFSYILVYDDFSKIYMEEKHFVR